MATNKPAPAPLYIEPERVRRKLAEVYRQRAAEARKATERAYFEQLAEAWKRTLPPSK